MTDNKKYFMDFVEQHQNELMIDPAWDIVKLVGFEDDGEDYYYIVYSGKRGKSFVSCVGKLIPLKGAISDEDYKDLIRSWDLNPHIWAYEQIYDDDAMKKGKALRDR